MRQRQVNRAKSPIGNPNLVQKQRIAFGRHQATYAQARFADAVDPQRLLQPNAKTPAQIASCTKQIVVIKAAISQQDHRTSFGKNGGCIFQDLLVFLKSHHRAMLLQYNPTQRQCSTSIDQGNPHNHKLIPQTAAVQCKVDPMVAPLGKDGLDQIGIDLRRLDLGISQPTHKLPLLTGGIRPACTMDTPFAQVDTFLQKYTHYRPGKCDQAAHIVKADSGVQNHVNYQYLRQK